MGLYCEAGVYHEDALFGPGCEKAASFGWRIEGRVVVFELFEHVLERGGSGRGWAHGEAEAVGLVVVVVGVLSEHYNFDGVKGGVSGPVQC